MGLMDKVKQQAEQAMSKAQQGVSQGQARLDQIQAKRNLDSLLRDLGAAYYAQVRQDGPSTAVDDALTAIDKHAAEHGPIDPSATSGIGQATTSGTSNLGEPAQGGSYTLDDV